jgi:hypothetical protein
MSVVWDSKCSKCRRAGVKLYLKGERCYTKSVPSSDATTRLGNTVHACATAR